MRRGSTVFEILAVLALIGALLGILFRFNNYLIENDLKDARARETATRELWLIRIDNPSEQIWMWTDEDGVEWVLFGSSNRVYQLGEIDG